MITAAISELVRYAERQELLDPRDRIWATNALLDLLQVDAPSDAGEEERPLEAILDEMLCYAVAHGLCGDSVTERDLFDTRLMGCLLPPPSEVERRFAAWYAVSPREATDRYYRFCGDCDYIRRARIARDEKWHAQTPYGTMEITINLSKPEKDPRAIAAAGRAVAVGYPRCMLCSENEGYAGRLDHPARQNLRPVTVMLDGECWLLQYSPYVYYNEHCIVLCEEHRPMHIDESTFRRLLALTTQFPHYFFGSNADLPIVGGSILSHDHFQGGRHPFAMAEAPIAVPLALPHFPDVKAGIVQWPMSVLRLNAEQPEMLVDAAVRILQHWRDYSDPAAEILAYSGTIPHNTITPIARRRGIRYELDLVLRNNRTTEEHPLGLFHPHEELHHIKKENIGLIEVMGLAVLPARLKQELADVAEALVEGRSLAEDPILEKHAAWAEALRQRHQFTAENAAAILRDEVGQVFSQVLADAGVFKDTPAGREAFLRFVSGI